MLTLSPSRTPNSPFASFAAHHVGFRVPNLDAALAWYREKLDLRVVGSSEANGMKFALLALPDDDSFRLEVLHGGASVQSPQVSDDLTGGLSTSGFNHVALQVGNLVEVVDELKRRAVRVLLEPFDNAELQMRVAFIADPWGSVIELIEPKGI